MRKELELIALIEQYLRNELNETERAEFEQRLQTDPRLQEEVALQRDLMAGAQRLGIRHEVVKAYRRYRINKNGWKWGLGALVAVVMGLVAWYHFVQNSEYKRAYELPEYNERGTKEWGDADRYLPYQFFTLDAQRDTVVETAGGIVVALPSDVFLDAKGAPAKGNIQLEMKEALTAKDILLSGLNTESNGRLLETGGMFYINARQDGQSLAIDPCKEIIVQVPSKGDDADMMLFDGVRTADGGINWVNPKPQANFLTPVDIFSLNFYPPAYLDSLRAWGYQVDDKPWRDSVFYNAVCDYAMSSAQAPSIKSELDVLGYLQDAIGTLSDTTDGAALSYTAEHCPGIQASSIKAIWSDRFQNTIIATKEFEERLAYLYLGCNEEALDLYIWNIDKPMYYTDSILGAGGNEYAMSGQFQKFAQQRKGSVPVSDARVKKLGQYYTGKRNAYAMAVAATYQKLKAERDAYFAEAGKKLSEETERMQQDFEAEFQLNLKEAYRQLGYPDIALNPPPPNPQPSVVTFTVDSTGWKNVDRYVAEATAQRKSLDYTDKDGYNAQIAYEQLKVKIGYEDRYERLYVYLLTPELNSFLRMKRDGAYFTENLNELFTYHVVCIGYVDGQLYFAKKTRVSAPDEMIVDMRKLPEKELDYQLKDLYPNAGKTMLKELDYQGFLETYRHQRQQYLAARQFNLKVMPVIYPCAPSCSNGERLFMAHCASCHKLERKFIGPGLLHVAERWDATYYQGLPGREWLKRFIRNWQDPVNMGHPYSVKMKDFDGSAMTAFPQLTDADLASLIMYMGECQGETHGE